MSILISTAFQHGKLLALYWLQEKAGPRDKGVTNAF